jgi:hypothetical protein
MSPRLKRIIAVWFVLQIFLPFTAPLQTLALGDLLPASHQSGAPLPPESSATPLPVAAFAAAHASSTAHAPALRPGLSVMAAHMPGIVVRGPRPLAFASSPLSAVQSTVLRL